jgi:hypothetical protein
MRRNWGILVPNESRSVCGDGQSPSPWDGVLPGTRKGAYLLAPGRLAFLCAVASMVLLVPRPRLSLGVIVASGNGSENMIAPPDDPGWNNVGIHGLGGAVYLGNRWAITADHRALVDTITFNGMAMAVEAGSEITLGNPQDSGLSTLTDLRLVRLQQDPGLPTLTISPATPAVGSDVIMIGLGHDRQPDLTGWTVSDFGGQITWTETPFPPFDLSGYKWATTQTKRWGTNRTVDDLQLDANDTDLDSNVIAHLEDEGVDVISLLTRFDDDESDETTDFESHATLGDSGGGVFVKTNGEWELSGIMFAVGVLEGQPEETAVFGNFTLSADLSFYRDEILSIIIDPVLQAGDADQDLDFDQLDLVKVQIASKYLTGQPATWGDGDWNGAPGGSEGNPPVGDGLFNQRDIIAAQLANIYLMGPYAALAPRDGIRGDGQTSIVYNPATGELALDAPATTQLTSINIDSASGIFTGAPAQNLGGSFDNDADNNIFKATFGSSFGSLSFGNVAQPGLAESFLLSDLTVVGSLAGGGALGDVDLIYVPEPTALLLVSLALLSIGGVQLAKGRRVGQKTPHGM